MEEFNSFNDQLNLYEEKLSLNRGKIQLKDNFENSLQDYMIPVEQPSPDPINTYFPKENIRMSDLGDGILLDDFGDREYRIDKPASDLPLRLIENSRENLRGIFSSKLAEVKNEKPREYEIDISELALNSLKEAINELRKKPVEAARDATVSPLFPVPLSTYADSAHHFRTGRMRLGPVNAFIHGIHEDPYLKAQITAFRKRSSQLQNGGQAGALHRVLSPFMSGIMTDPEAHADFMDAVDDATTRESNELKDFVRQNSGMQVDVLIVGAGVQGSVAAAQLREQNPELSIVVVDKADRIGGQFRSYGDRPTFRINSRAHRSENTEVTALPGGDDNLNTFGATAMMQLPDMSTETYPVNTELGDTAAMNLFFSAPTMLGVEVMSRGIDGTMEMMTLNDTATGEEYTIAAQRVVMLTGAGERKTERISDNVWSVEDVLRHFGNSEEMFPMEAFAGKSVAVIGGGDSGRIIVELLTRLGPKEAYGNSVAQLGGPESISWYGVDFASRDEFCQRNRSRYEQLQAFIANPDEPVSVARLVRPIPRRAELIDRDNRDTLRIIDTSGSRNFVDIVIDATNLQRVAEIAGLGGAFAIPGYVDTIGTTDIARKYGNNEVYVAGPAAQIPLTVTERRTFPTGIKENTVAIWANAPRVERLSQQIARSLRPVKN